MTTKASSCVRHIEPTGSIPAATFSWSRRENRLPQVAGYVNRPAVAEADQTRCVQRAASKSVQRGRERWALERHGDDVEPDHVDAAGENAVPQGFRVGGRARHVSFELCVCRQVSCSHAWRRGVPDPSLFFPLSQPPSPQPSISQGRPLHGHQIRQPNESLGRSHVRPVSQYYTSSRPPLWTSLSETFSVSGLLRSDMEGRPAGLRLRVPTCGMRSQDR